jgi:hypothetical protein
LIHDSGSVVKFGPRDDKGPMKNQRVGSKQKGTTAADRTGADPNPKKRRKIPHDSGKASGWLIKSLRL